MSQMTPGARFRAALEANRPLPILGTINAYTALMAEKVGHQAIYLSGGGVANASFGLPDLGMTTMNDVVEDAHRICGATELPLLVDIDTGWGGAFNIARTVKEMQRAGVAAVHMEDQVAQKRCGHRPNKAIVTQQEMVDRIKAAADAKIDPDFYLIARTDAFQKRGLDAAIERANACVEAGADAILPKRSTRWMITKLSVNGSMRRFWPISPSSALRHCLPNLSWATLAVAWCFTRSLRSEP
ncbi:hypothetical protein HSBAA_41890 [Vreelandella sulfidaeris]|uniref:Methylisocitrate lyase n=1 Tax=Vreelandella sulfidaeris TaxID=115553 RepID=A0A455UC67_9GAMM|nr:hypothetical protein HSBAA_41890 [Halomonas sulfidaeris]